MNKEEYKYPAIGKARFKEIESVCQWYESEDCKEWYLSAWKEHIYPRSNENSPAIHQLLQSNVLTPHSYSKSETERMVARAKKMNEYTCKLGFSLEVLYADFGMMVVGYGKLRLLLPDELVDYKLHEDYSGLSMQELKMLGGTASGEAAVQSNALQGVTRASVLGKKNKIAAQQQVLNSEQKRIEEGAHEALATIKAELDRIQAQMKQKQEALLAELEKKKVEMEEKMAEYERQLFVLDSQIYSIRCYLGEAIEFGEIREGIAAPVETPVVLYQKFRYLDEELGRMASIYDISGDSKELEYIESFLRHNGNALEHFCPSPKCIALVKISRDGKVYAPHEKFRDMLQEYEVFHGQRIGILIRNGDNLWAGWTDEDRIRLNDDMFLTPKEVTSAPIVINEDDDYNTKFEKQQILSNLQRDAKKNQHEMVSRFFIYSILQGLLERKEIIELPEVGNILRTITETNPYIIFSAADNMLEDNRFGSFNEIVERCNSIIKEKHMILTTQRLSPTVDSDYKRQCERWHNPRGRGEMNRTHDVSVGDNCIYPINLVEQGEPRKKVVYKYPIGHSTLFKGSKEDPSMLISETTFSADTDPRERLSKECEIVSEELFNEQIYFVSLQKTDTYNRSTWEKTDSRANFRVYPNEFINLTFLNSVWLLYAINSKKLGGWRITGSAVNYAYAVRYLNKALEHVREREKNERENILGYYPNIDSVADWQVFLSEWKLENEVREITPYQAKRFVKWMVDKGMAR